MRYHVYPLSPCDLQTSLAANLQANHLYLLYKSLSYWRHIPTS